MLAAVEDKESLYLLTDAATGKPWDEQRLGHVFAGVRTKPALQIRALRHSCVVQLARAECTVPEIGAITGHSPFSVEQILRKHLPRHVEVAWNAQRKRELIGTKDEQKSDSRPTGESDGPSKPAAKVGKTRKSSNG